VAGSKRVPNPATGTTAFLIKQNLLGHEMETSRQTTRDPETQEVISFWQTEAVARRSAREARQFEACAVGIGNLAGPSPQRGDAQSFQARATKE